MPQKIKGKFKSGAVEAYVSGLLICNPSLFLLQQWLQVVLVLEAKCTLNNGGGI